MDCYWYRRLIGIIYQWTSSRLFIPRGDINVFLLCIKWASRAFLTASRLLRMSSSGIRMIHIFLFYSFSLSFHIFLQVYCTDQGLQLGDPAPLIGLLLWTCWHFIFSEKEPWLRLVTWKCVSISCAAGVGPPLNFVDWTMKYYLGRGENYCFKMALEFLSCEQTPLLFWR